ncbi:MAG TPA: hypothetical protein VJA26_16775, partial [Gammaproteobacteria bacterium]|nr:hypothetical protein [Gammaproteobacteria bacterium]
MNQQVLVVAQSLALFVAASSAYAQAPDPIEPRYEWFRDLDIEAAVAQSELILITRIDEVKEIPLPVGGKGESVMLQIQFKPVRVLKGVFAREGLTLTSYDLGIAQSRTGLDRLKPGDMRLLFLGRSRSGYQNRNVAPDVDRSLLLLRDEQDPMTSTVGTLLAVHAASNRESRVTLLTEALTRTRGAAAVPLLNALPRRALLAAQRDATFAAIAPHLSDSSPAVRIAAGEALRAVLAVDYLEQRVLREPAASALGAALRLEQPNAAARIALIGAAGELRPAGPGVVPPLAPGALLVIERAQIKALGRLGKERARFESVLASLPLDHPNADAYETEFARADPEAAVTLIPQRARLKLAAGLFVEDEIDSATAMPLELAVVTLGQLATFPLN